MTEVTITTETLQLVLSPPEQPDIVLQVPAPVVVELAAQGIQGPAAPVTWSFYKDHWSSIPTTAGTTAAGSVLAYTLDGVTRYRLVPAPYDPAQDAFYTTFTGGVLSGLIAARG